MRGIAQPSPTTKGCTMNSYAIFSKFHEDQNLSTLPQRSQAVKDKIIAAAPALTAKWSHKFAFLGGKFDAMDVVTADDPADVALAADIIEHTGGCDVEVSAALSWGDYISANSGKPHTLPPRTSAPETTPGVARYAIFTKFPAGFNDSTLPDLSIAVRHTIVEEVPSLTAKWVCDLILLG